MLRFLCVFIIYFLCGLFMFGQENKEYEPFHFENFNPVWQHVVIDSSLKDSFKEVDFYTGDSLFYDGFSQFYGYDILQVSPVFYNNKTFLIEQFGSILASEGAFIQCMNRSTGELIWQTGYDLRNIEKSEYPSYAYINNQGQLEILGYRQDVSKGPYLFGYWNFAKLTVRKYDIETGNLLEQLLISEDDSLAIELWPTSPLLSLGVKSNIYPYGTSEFQYLELNGDKLISFVLNSDSYIKDTIININLLHKYIVKIQFKMYRSSKNENIVLIYDQAYGTQNLADSSEFYIMKIDNANNLLVDKDIKQELEPTDSYSRTYNIFENDDFITLVGEKHIDIGDTTVPLMIYTVFDSDANKIEEITLTDENGLPYFHGDYSFRVGQVLKLKYEPGILIFAVELGADGYQYLNIFKTDGAGNYTLVKHLKVTGKNHSLAPTGAYFTPEGDVVLKALDFNSDFANYTNSNTFATVYMLFAAEDLDIKTGIKEPLVYHRMNIFPNPAKDEVSVELENNITGKIEIFDVFGRKLITNDIIDEKTHKLNISSFSDGVYFVKLIVDGQIYAISEIIKD